MEPVQMILIFFIVLVASVVKGSTGFGLALIAMPLLSFFLPIKFLVPLITIFNLVTSVIIICQNLEFKYSKDEIIIPIFGVIGIIIGSMFLPAFSDIFLKRVLAIVLIILATAFLSGYRFKIRNILRARIGAGLTSGFLGGLFSIIGPPMVLFLTSLGIDKTRFRLSFTWYSLVTTSVAFISYLLSGIVTFRTLIFALILLPVLIAGTWIGSRIAKKLPSVAFTSICLWITLLSGIMIFMSATFR